MLFVLFCAAHEETSKICWKDLYVNFHFSLGHSTDLLTF